MMPSFEYIRVNSVDEAIKHLSTGNAKIHAGGTDLLGCMRDRIFPVERIVSIRGIKGLSGINETLEGMTIGSLTTITQVATSPVVARLFPGLAMAAGEVASPQLRNQGTIGGNICQKPRCWYYRGEFDCIRKGGMICYAVAGENKFHCVLGGENCFMVHPSDMAPMLIALGASLIAKGPKGIRRIAAENLYVNPSDDPQREIVLEPGEIITEIVIPKTSGRHYSSYRKIRARRSWDFALAGVALALQLEGRRVLRTRVVLSGAAPVPWRSKEVEDVITGRSLDRATIARAASVVMKQANPLAQNRYKINLFQATMEEELERASQKAP
jgi:xanthine dehydrogenase YagS FAD-binding subunit